MDATKTDARRLAELEDAAAWAEHHLDNAVEGIRNALRAAPASTSAAVGIRWITEVEAVAAARSMPDNDRLPHASRTTWADILAEHDKAAVELAAARFETAAILRRGVTA